MLAWNLDSSSGQLKAERVSDGLWDLGGSGCCGASVAVLLVVVVVVSIWGDWLGVELFGAVVRVAWCCGSCV